MGSIPLGYTDIRRGVSDAPQIRVVNRFFEDDPTNQVEQVALIARPGLKRWLQMGDGPIRGVYSQSGTFNEALFVVSGDALYRVDVDETITFIGSGIFGRGLRASVSMAATDEALFIADGRTLWLYVENGFSVGTLTATGAVETGDKIKIDDTYYQWTDGDVDTGTPAGTSGAPWLVALGADNLAAFSNMRLAINEAGTPGETYSTALTVHETVQATGATETFLKVAAREPGVEGDTIATTVETGANIAWGAAVLADGGTPSLTTVLMPTNAEDVEVGPISVGYIAGYIIIVVAQGFGFNGRFYWIEPGEIVVDPLNFATAERSPDGLWSVRVVGDQFWLLGVNTTEVWYPTGDFDAPFLRIQGRLFDRGIWSGTDVQIRDKVFVIDQNGMPVVVQDGPREIGRPDIVERIRKAIAKQIAGPDGRT